MKYLMSRMQNQRNWTSHRSLLLLHNTLIQFCKQQEGMILCSRCVLHNSCPAITDRASAPEKWEEIHYPRMTSNTTIEYLKDGRAQLITYGRSEDAEKAFKEMKNNGI